MRLTENHNYLTQLRAIEGLDFLNGEAVLITGASGMLGNCLVDLIMLWNKERELGCRVIALGRNGQKLEERFHDYIERSHFEFVAQDVCQPLDGLSGKVNYIIHAASNADPTNMAKYPVDTLLANTVGTKYLLDFGLANGMERFLFVSSGEVYGQPNENRDSFTEDYCGQISLENPRSCYPEGKRAAEVLCQSYAAQFGVDVVIARPCHLFGPTMSRLDSRAVAEFIWSAAEGRDIVMKSSGRRERSHCYVVDAAAAILLVLRQGLSKNAYNIADMRYQMEVQEFAKRAADMGNCKVLFDLPSETERMGYSRVSRQVLDSKKLEDLGWRPAFLEWDLIAETINILRECAHG